MSIWFYDEVWSCYVFRQQKKDLQKLQVILKENVGIFNIIS